VTSTFDLLNPRPRVSRGHQLGMVWYTRV